MIIDENLNDVTNQYVNKLKKDYKHLKVCCCIAVVATLLFVACMVTADVIITDKNIESNNFMTERLLDCEQLVIDVYNEDITGLSHEDSTILLATAFALQETKCHNVDSPDGKYCGYLQMSEIMVREVNRLIGKDIYTYDDRYDWDKCLAMFSIIMDNKNPSLDVDIAVDIWNEKCHKVYRNQVKTYYNFLLNKTLNYES